MSLSVRKIIIRKTAKKILMIFYSKTKIKILILLKQKEIVFYQKEQIKWMQKNINFILNAKKLIFYKIQKSSKNL